MSTAYCINCERNVVPVAGTCGFCQKRVSVPAVEQLRESARTAAVATVVSVYGMTHAERSAAV